MPAGFVSNIPARAASGYSTNEGVALFAKNVTRLS